MIAVAAIPTIGRPIVASQQLPVIEIFTAAEALAIVAIVALVMRSFGFAPSWGALVAATAAAAFTILALTLQPAAVEILMLWNLGLAGYFHPVLYGLAAAAAAYVAYQAWRYGDHTTLVGIGLLIAGGIGLHSTWQAH